MERQRIVIKVGSHVLRWRDKVSRKRLDALVQLIAELTGEEYKCHNVHSKRSYRDINCNLSKKNFDVILVSSGAVSAGYSKLKLNRASIQDKQALAAIGQPLLLRRYQESFSKYGMLCSQILLSADVFDSREHTSHAKNAIDKLLENGVVPIINENDTVSIDELVFGDNDQLSAHVTHYFDAELLVILSDIDAFYDKDPHRYTDAKRLSTVSFIEAEALSAEHTPNNEFATGGIVTKLKSADFLMKKHRKMFLASGFNLNDVKSFLIDEQHIGGTLFKASNEKEAELFL